MTVKRRDMDRMISLERCRKVLGPNNRLSDESLATVREQLYCFAELSLNIWDYRKGTESDSLSLRQFCDSEERLEELEERAAIMEFEGNQTRDEAERLAISLSLANDE